MISKNHSRKLMFSSVMFFALSISIAALANHWFQAGVFDRSISFITAFLTWGLVELTFVRHTRFEVSLLTKIMSAAWVCVGIFLAALAFLSNPGPLTDPGTVAGVRAITLSIILISITGLAFSIRVAWYKKKHKLDKLPPIPAWI